MSVKDSRRESVHMAMAGIFGIHQYSGADRTAQWVQDNAESDRASLETTSTIVSRPFHAVGATSREYDTSVWVAESHDNRYALAVYGRIYLSDDTIVNPSNFEERFLQPFLSSPIAFLRSLNGSFLFALLSEAECIVANDAFGNFAVHYSWSHEQFAFATQMMNLRDFAAGFNERGLLEQFAVGQTLSGRTVLQNVHRLERATMLRATCIGIIKEQYWSPDFSIHVDSPKERVFEELQKSVARAVTDPGTTASLSGGFDSRLTWSIILANDRARSITANTHGLPTAFDVRIAHRIAKGLNISFDFLPYNHEALREIANSWREFVLLTGGQYPLWQTQTLFNSKYLGKRYSTIVDSSGGAIYRRQIANRTEGRIDNNKELGAQLLPAFLAPLSHSGLLSDEIRTEAIRAARQGFIEYCSTLPAMSPGDTIDRLYVDQLIVLRDSIEANLQMNFIRVEQPLFSAKAWHAAINIPITLRRTQAVHKYIIGRTTPSLEQFWLDTSGYLAPYRGFHRFRTAGPALQFGLDQISKRLPFFPKISIRRPLITSALVLKEKLPFAKEILLSAHNMYDHFVDRDGIGRALRTFEENQTGAEAILQLLTYRLFLDVFY